MKFRDYYFNLNWSFLNEQGITKVNDSLSINGDGCSFLKRISCPFTLASILFMACHSENSIISADEMYTHFLDDSRGNAFYFETVLERLIKESVFMRVE